MKRKGLLLATVFFLCALLFMPQEKTEAAAFNLVKKVATVSVPKGRIVRTAKGRRYRYGTRKYLKMRWAKIGKYIYHFNRKGYADTGFIKLRKKTYYLQKNGRLWLNGKIKINGKYYYFSKSFGYMLTNRWKMTDGVQNYYGEDGVMVTNAWIGARYVDENGKKVRNAWVDGHYLGANAKMVTNTWVDGYYLNSSGVIATNTWVDGKYLGADGKVVDQSVSTEKKRIFLGDSRTVGMCKTMTGLISGSNTPSLESQMNRGETDLYLGRVGEGYTWLQETALPKLQEVLAIYPHSVVAINLGVNDMGNISNYISLYQQLLGAYPNTTFLFVSVNPVNKSIAKKYGYDTSYVNNTNIRKFNRQLKAAFPSQYVDCYTYMTGQGYTTVDGLHYSANTYTDIYHYLLTVMG